MSKFSIKTFDTQLRYTYLTGFVIATKERIPLKAPLLSGATTTSYSIDFPGRTVTVSRPLTNGKSDSTWKRNPINHHKHCVGDTCENQRDT